MSDARSDTLDWRRDLAVVVRFVDGFTGQPVRDRFQVSIPKFAVNSAGWWSESDATYRFSLPNLELKDGVPEMPSGTFSLTVMSSDGVNLYSDPPQAPPKSSYAALMQLQVTIPPVAAHQPPVLATDYLVELPLWPTASFRVPAGETAVLGWIVSAGRTSVAALKLKLLQLNTGASGEPWVSTDAAGQFLYRLPNLARPAGPDPQVTLTIEMVDQMNRPLTVAPSSLTISFGKLSGPLRFTVP
jgi:hypothetical protein